MHEQSYTPKGQFTESIINISKEERKLSTVSGIALLTISVVRRDWVGLGLGMLGLGMLLRGMTGFSAIYKILGENTAIKIPTGQISVPHQQGIHVSESIVVHRPVETVYAFWRDFSNLALFMPYVKSVHTLSNTRSHWKIHAPGNMEIGWDAEIINDIPNTVIGWRSLENPYVDHAGSVRFKPVSSNTMTEVRVEMEYSPLGGPAGKAITDLLGMSPKEQIRESLRRLKDHLEGNSQTAFQRTNMNGHESS